MRTVQPEFIFSLRYKDLQGSHAVTARKKGEVSSSRVQALLQTHFACHYHLAHPHHLETSGWNSFSGAVYGALGGTELHRGIPKHREQGWGWGGCRRGCKTHTPGLFCIFLDEFVEELSSLSQTLWHGTPFRSTKLSMVVTIPCDSMKSISSPVTSKCYRTFKCDNEKVKWQKKYKWNGRVHFHTQVQHWWDTKYTCSCSCCYFSFYLFI